MDVANLDSLMLEIAELMTSDEVDEGAEAARQLRAMSIDVRFVALPRTCFMHVCSRALVLSCFCALMLSGSQPERPISKAPALLLPAGLDI
jgi:hypothetical protein